MEEQKPTPVNGTEGGTELPSPQFGSGTPAPNQPSELSQPTKQEPATFKLDNEAVNGNGQNKPSILAKLVGSSAVPASANGAGGNVFTKLFGKGTGEAPSESVHKPVLGPRPLLSESSTFLREVEVKKAHRAASVLIIVLLALLAGAGYLLLMLNPEFTYFGPNVAVRFATSNDELKTIQTNINEQNFRIARLHLDRINHLGDAFRHHANRAAQAALPAAERALSETELNRLRVEIKTSLAVVQNIFKQPFAIPLYSETQRTPEEAEADFVNALKADFEKQKAQINAADDPQLILERRTLENILQLVSKRPLLQQLAKENLNEITDDKVMELLTAIEKTGGDDLSILSRIKGSRIQWTQIIADIEAVTREVDALFGQGLYDEIGGIRYTGYDFNKDSGTISITGVTKTEDSRTFSLIANLIDRFEKSSKFKDVEMRSFAKSESDGGGFSSSIRLSFALQNAPDSRDEILTSTLP